jgi:hypothetical protein
MFNNQGPREKFTLHISLLFTDLLEIRPKWIEIVKAATFSRDDEALASFESTYPFSKLLSVL